MRHVRNLLGGVGRWADGLRTSDGVMGVERAAAFYEVCKRPPNSGIKTPTVHLLL